MHELSIALRIVEIAEDLARKHRASVIEEIEIEIGRMAGVELQTFYFALESAVKNTMLENARVLRRDVNGEGLCTGCGACFVAEGLFEACPRCGSHAVKLIGGKELRIKSIVINR